MNVNSPVSSQVVSIAAQLKQTEYQQKYDKIEREMRKRFFKKYAFDQYVASRLGTKGQESGARLWRESLEDEEVGGLDLRTHYVDLEA